MTKEIKGFSPQNERNFLQRLPQEIREKNLGQELKTQLAEDFGLVKFSLRYEMRDGLITDIKSGQRVVELTSRGEIEEETESIRKIEAGLRENPSRSWIHFSPKNEKLGYPENCIDVWRTDEEGIIWNRIVINNNFEEMNRVRQMLEVDECQDEMKILRSPVSVEIKLPEIFSLFSLSSEKYYKDYGYIEKVVDNYIKKFKGELGDQLMEDKDLIFRLYSACHNYLKSKKTEEVLVGREDTYRFMYGKMQEMKIEASFGCAGSTLVGAFGERIGYYVTAEGRIAYGVIPEDCKICEKCGLPYLGKKCPFCP